MYITNDSSFKYFAPILISVLISVLTIIVTRRNVKKQIRVNKLEELIGIMWTFYTKYDTLYPIYLAVKRLHESNNSVELKTRVEKLREDFKKDTPDESLVDITKRFIVLADSYLPNKSLKAHIMEIGTLYINLYDAALRGGYKEPIKNRILRPNDFKEITGEVIADLVKEMKMGYKSFTIIELENKQKPAFKNKLDEYFKSYNS